MTQGEMFEPPKTADVSALEKIEEVRRELGYREKVYGRLVAERKMTRATADRRILVMQAVLADLYHLLERENQAAQVNGTGISINIDNGDQSP